MCYGTENSVFHTLCTEDHFPYMFYYSMQLSICTMNYVLEWPIFVLPLGLSWMSLFCTILWLLSCFYLLILQVSTQCHLGELLFIWTYLCGNKVDHKYLLLTFCIFCVWALTSICLMVPFCQSLHIKTYFIVLSSCLGSHYSLSLWHFLGWLCRICAVHLLAIPFFFTPFVQ